MTEYVEETFTCPVCMKLWPRDAGHTDESIDPDLVCPDCCTICNKET